MSLVQPRFGWVSAGQFILLSVLVGGPATGAYAGGESVSADNAMRMYEAATNRIASYDLYLTDEITKLVRTERVGTPGAPDYRIASARPYREGEAPKPSRRFYRQTYQAGRIRIDTLDGPGGAVIHSIASDGETEKAFDAKGRTAAFRPVKLEWFTRGTDYRCSFLNFLGNIPLIGCLRGRTNVKCWMEDGLCHIESEGQVGARSRLPHSGVHAAFDPGKGFFPVMVEEFSVKDGKRLVEWRTRTVAFGSTPAGEVPIRYVTQFFDPKEPLLFGLAIAEQVDTVDVAKSRWNISVPETRFDIPIPAGVKLFDETRNLRVIVGKNDPGKNMDDLVNNAKDVVRLRPATPPPSHSLAWAWVVSVIGLACLGGAATVWYLRTVRARS